MPAYVTYPGWIHPQIIPGLPIRWYGLMYLVAFVIAYLLFRWQLKERKIEAPKDAVIDMFFWGIVGLLIGARLLDVIVYDPQLFKTPLQIIMPFARQNGKVQLTGIAGMSYHGGLLGATIAIVIYLRRKKISVLDWGDMLVAGIPLGYTFGRLGNFINAELYGRITRVPWGMVFPRVDMTFDPKLPWVKDFAASVGMPISGTALVNLPRHPSQLYEAFFEGIVLWLILWFIVRKRKPFKGFVIAIYVIGYAVFRFLIEYTRQPDPGLGPFANGYRIVFQRLPDYYAQFSPFNFTTGQILNVVMIAVAVIFILVRRSQERATALAPQAGPRPTDRKLRKKLR
jgi:phosphatidylglycerol---prolipoprotein diacylglyceryl transferase